MTAADFLPISGWDHVEFYVGNARQAAHFYEKTFGFEPVAKTALETGSRDRASYVLKQGDIRFVFTSALGPDHEIARHCQLHGDGVKTIALEVPDCDATMNAVRLRQATILQPSQEAADEHGVIKTGVIKYAGDTVIKFVERGGYRGAFAPGYKPLRVAAPTVPQVGLRDRPRRHQRLSREMNYWAAWFERVLGFKQLRHFTDKDISTEYSALMSKVMEDGRQIKLPINEPPKAVENRRLTNTWSGIAAPACSTSR